MPGSKFFVEYSYLKPGLRVYWAFFTVPTPDQKVAYIREQNERAYILALN